MTHLLDVGLALLVPLAGFTIGDPRIVEASGLAVVDGYVVTTNDSGDDARIFVLDRRGRTVGVTTYADEVTDVEALAPAGGREVWVADVGDNDAERESVTVFRVPVAPGERTVTAPAYEVVLPAPVDVETLLADPVSGRLHLVAKDLASSAVYALPARLRPDGPNRAREVARVPVYATDGAVLPDGEHAVIRDYLGARVFTYPGFEPRGPVALPRDRQGESVAVLGARRLLVVGEGERPRVREATVPASALTRPTASASPSPTAEPTPELDTSERPVRVVGGLRVVIVVAALALVGAVTALQRRRRRRRRR